MGSSRTRDRTSDPCIARWMLNPWTTKEARVIVLLTGVVWLILAVWGSGGCRDRCVWGAGMGLGCGVMGRVVKVDQWAKQKSQCVDRSWHPGFSGDLISQDFGVSSKWPDRRPQLKGSRAPSESAILNHCPRSGPTGEGWHRLEFKVKFLCSNSSKAWGNRLSHHLLLLLWPSPLSSVRHLRKSAVGAQQAFHRAGSGEGPAIPFQNGHPDWALQAL